MFFCLGYAGLAADNPGVLYFGFIGSSTVVLYCIHRYIGYDRVLKSESLDQRYNAIAKVIPIYPFIAVVCSIIAGFCLYTLGWGVMKILWFPCFVSLAYVLPIFGNGKRLRDIPYVKIILIAITWTWFSTWFLAEAVDLKSKVLANLDHFLFMLGITLPFDIRDKDIDHQDGVPTFVSLLGIEKGKAMSAILLTISGICVLSITINSTTNLVCIASYILLYSITIFLILRKSTYHDDLYLTGLLDGSLLIKGLIGMLTFA